MTWLTKEQHSVVKQLLTGLNCEPVLTLGGYAGTGKTTVLAVLAKRLPEFACCAFTGKAANIMRRKGMTASTIHSLIYVPVRRREGGVEFVLRSPAEIAYRGFLVDEASMVGHTLYDDLLSFGRPVIFVGDHGQLPPVADAIVPLMREPMFRLEQIHRNAGPIAHFAQHLRQGRAPQRFDGSNAVRLLARSEVTDGMVRKAAGCGQIICGYNRTRVLVNQAARLLLGKTDLLADGDRVMCLRNNRAAGLFNGMQGTVSEVDLTRHTFTFAADGAASAGVEFDPDVFGTERPDLSFIPGSPHPFDYAYCVSAHKAQGDEWGRVLVFEEAAPRLWDQNCWNYTAASRAKVRLLWAAPAGRASASVPQSLSVTPSEDARCRHLQ